MRCSRARAPWKCARASCARASGCRTVTLQRLLGLASSGRGAGGGAMLLHRDNGARKALQLVVSPVQRDTRARTPGVMVLVTDPETEICFPDTVLKGLYGLTPAEAEVANAYLTGYTSDEIALLRGVSLSTVRSQLNVLLQKTGTRRQSDLMRLLLTLPRTGPSYSANAVN